MPPGQIEQRPFGGRPRGNVDRGSVRLSAKCLRGAFADLPINQFASVRRLQRHYEHDQRRRWQVDSVERTPVPGKTARSRLSCAQLIGATAIVSIAALLKSNFFAGPGRSGPISSSSWAMTSAGPMSEPTTRAIMSGRTPNLDRLAAEGMRFTDYYAEASCTAGRANFITGELPIRTGLTTVGQAGSPLGMPERGGDDRDRAQINGLCHGPVRQEPPGRPTTSFCQRCTDSMNSSAISITWTRWRTLAIPTIRLR